MTRGAADGTVPRAGTGVTRRDFLWGASALGVAMAGCRSAARPWTRPVFGSNPFSLGVASGDPRPDGVVLWTRLAPDPLAGGGMPGEVVPVRWEVALDDRMSRVVSRGEGRARPEFGHAVHVDVTGLRPDRWYWYRFSVAGEESMIGRTRTAPRADARVDRARFAFLSCQHYEQGLYTAHRHLAEEDLDLMVFLGDYIYEGAGIPDRVRLHPDGECHSLVDYRNRYALYRLDPDLQAAHASVPWIVTWDDHEVDNNYANVVPEDDQDGSAFLARRVAAYQAYYEHMPLRPSSIPRGPDMQLYRSLPFGTLAAFHVLDTRQFRTDQPCGDRLKPPCPGVFDLSATMLGTAQERWLFDRLDRSPATWNVLAQQVLMADVDREAGAEERYHMDQWSGYAVSRQRILEYLDRRRPSNPIVVTGDIHTNWVADLQPDFRDPASPVVATEFVGTSMSSGGDGRDTYPSTAGVLAENPFVKFFNGQRGYVRCEITPDAWTADYRVVEYVTRPGAPIATRARFRVENGRRGVVPA